jgi:cytochrome c553
MFNSRKSIMVGAAAMLAAVAMPANAQEIDASVAICAACHGPAGVPTTPATTPIIWGQQGSYLFKELHDFRSGDRESPIMGGIAKNVKQEDMRKIAAYFAAKTWPAKQGTATAEEPAILKNLNCRACHQQNFEGGPPAPRLAGLSYEYLVGAMKAFADGTRTNNLDMPGFMKALSETDREAIAKYLSTL